MFNAVDTDRSGKITPKELQSALQNGKGQNFSDRCCQLLVCKLITSFYPLYVPIYLLIFYSIIARKKREEYVMNNSFFFSQNSAMFDTSNAGSVDIHQFNKMYEYINQWLNIFKTYDRNASGLIDDQELNQGKYYIRSTIANKSNSHFRFKFQHFHKWDSIFRQISRNN